MTSLITICVNNKRYLIIPLNNKDMKMKVNQLGDMLGMIHFMNNMTLLEITRINRKIKYVMNPSRKISWVKLNMRLRRQTSMMTTTKFLFCLLLKTMTLKLVPFSKHLFHRLIMYKGKSLLMNYFMKNNLMGQPFTITLMES